MIGTTMGTRMI